MNMSTRAKTIEILNKKFSIKEVLLLLSAFLLAALGFAFIYYTITTGIGVWGLTNEVVWGLDITNFVFWIGLAHAGTLISAILFLFNARWRIVLHRQAETMTIITLICAAIYPIIHTGRPWFAAYWLIPYPSTMGMWVNFRSALVWDVFAIITYLIISLLFWYINLLPDVIELQNETKNFRHFLFNKLALGLKKFDVHSEYYRSLYTILSGLVTAVVISVHTIVSLDFASSIVPIWHSTFFPPYFVAGAIFSGTAAIVIIIQALRKSYKLNNIITEYHFDNMSKIILSMSVIITTGYFFEYISIMSNSNSSESVILNNRFYTPIFWTVFICNSIIPLFLIKAKIRRNANWVCIISVFIIIGMWLERYMIIVPSLAYNQLQGSLSTYFPTLPEIGISLGSIGLFIFLFVILIRIIPIFPLFEISEEVEK